MDEPKQQSLPPRWLLQTKRLFPHPIFAACISLSCLMVAVIFMGVAIGEKIWPMYLASLIFFAGAYATARAALFKKSTVRSPDLLESDHLQRNKPTFAILVLLIGVYSWLLTIGMHVFAAFFKNGPGSTKYYVTLGIAISASIFMQVHGKHVVRKHFGATGGRKLLLDSRQIIYVVVVVMCCSFYLVWLGS